MSNALSRLRDYFGDPLLVQVQRRMDLTPRAQALQEPVRDLLVRIRATVATEPEFDPTNTDRCFNVFASDYTLHTVVPSMLALAGAGKSSVQFRFQPLLGPPAKALESGDADLLIIPERYCSTTHPKQLLLQEDFVCVAWAGSAHAQGGLSRESYLASQHVVMVPPAHANTRAYEGLAIESAGLSRRIGVITYAFASMPLMVIGTEYLATIHRRLADGVVGQHPLVVLPCPVSIPPMSLMMQWHEVRSSDPGIRWLRDVMLHAVDRRAGTSGLT